MKFSDRIGITAPRATFQKDDIDPELLNRLWSVFYNATLNWHETNRTQIEPFVRFFWMHYLKRPIDRLPDTITGAAEEIRAHFYRGPWYQTYNVIEFAARRKTLPAMSSDEFVAICNVILKQEMSAYRFVGGQLVPLTGDAEVAAVEEALDATKRESKLSGVHKHLASAVEKFGTRPKGDYVNAIKESISAVESAVRVITNTNATLGQGLKLLRDKRVTIHPALEKGFEKIFGYTSDAEGIRHGMMEDSQADLYEEAKFMLPACSAFVHYLIGKAAEARAL